MTNHTNEVHRESVARASAELNNCGLPNVQEIVALVKQLSDRMALRALRGESTDLVERAQSVVRQYNSI